jgi:hypothetical protein
MLAVLLLVFNLEYSDVISYLFVSACILQRALA